MKQSEYTLRMSDGSQRFCSAWHPEITMKAGILLIHGLGEHIGRYQAVADILTSAGYLVAGFDLRGHGKSDGERGHYPSYERALADIAEFEVDLRKRVDVPALFLYGHSLGGNLGLNYILRKKPSLAGAVITSPGLRMGTKVPGWKLFMARNLCSITPRLSMANGLDLNNLSRDPAVKIAYQADPLVHGRISARFGWDFLQAGEWALSHAAEFPLPLLLQVGSKDHLISPEAVQEFARSSKADLKVWPDLYHETHNEINRDEVLKVMSDWLDRHLAAH